SEAYLIEGGVVGRPVRDATLIGNGPDVLTRITRVGSDLALDEGLGTCGKDGQSVPVGVGLPTVRIDGLTVVGTRARPPAAGGRPSPRRLARGGVGGGARAPDPLAGESDGLGVGVRLGAVEKIKRARERRAGLRVFVGDSTAVVSTADLSAEGLAGLASDACA